MQLMGQGGLRYRTLQLKKSLRNHSTMSTIMNHPIHFSISTCLTLPVTTPAHLQGSSSSFPSSNAMSPAVPKKCVRRTKKVLSNHLLIQCHSSLVLASVPGYEKNHPIGHIAKAPPVKKASLVSAILSTSAKKT